MLLFPWYIARFFHKPPHKQRFQLRLPVTVPGVDEKILNPRDTWDSLAAYDLASANLAREFAQQIETYAGHNLNPNILTECPSV